MKTVTPEVPGLDILNCADGHTEIRFDGDEVEIARAARIISDMLRRGYVLFVHGEGGVLLRVEKFDPEKRVYVIADGPLYAGDAPVVEVSPATEDHPAIEKVGGKLRGRGRPKKEVPMGEVKATAIGRSAGG